ncbi:MAG: DoxX family protein [Candidatus Omnitrophica bacterium]|nr:DoxX family protein [Candidatus Omnitrophota bacterium]
MDDKIKDTKLSIAPRELSQKGLQKSLSQPYGKKSIQEIAAKWWWLAPLLARMVVGIVFIQTGLNQLHDLNHSKDVLNFFWIAVPASHRWDPFFSSVEVICGAFLLFGLLTRAAAIPLFGIIVAAILSSKFKELTGLNLSALQEFAMISLLIGICVAGAGPVSLDRFIFKRDAAKAD